MKDDLMLSLNNLREFYKRGMADKANKAKANKNKNEKAKYEDLKAKFTMLSNLTAVG